MSLRERGSGVIEGVALAVLVIDGALLAVFGMVFNPLYAGTVPLPMGAVLTVLVMPWLVARAAEVDPRTAVAVLPLVAWGLAVVVAAFVGPGGDVLLPATWQSLLLCAAGFGAGLHALRRVDSGYGDSGYGRP
ncbi:MAG: hypothetical protein ACT4RN_19995 [Pseudonocardia sp.]